MASMKGTVVVYEFYNIGHNYYYSPLVDPYDNSWKLVGKFGFVYSCPTDDAVAIHEFGKDGDHYLSTNVEPYDSNWIRTRRLGYVLTKETEGASPVYEFYASAYDCHYYSSNPEPRENVFQRSDKPVFYIPNGCHV